MIRNVGTAEYEFVATQAAGRAICPFCQAWHDRAGGTPDAGDCEGRYVRLRKVAIVVRGRPTGLGTGVRIPTALEKKEALEHAYGVAFG
jgi:hypothetical protein